MFYTPLIIPKELLGTPEEDAFIEKDIIYTEGMKLPPKERDKYFISKTLEEIRKRPVNFIERTLWRFFKLWRLYPYHGHNYAHSWFLLLIISLLSDAWIIPLAVYAGIKLSSRFKELFPFYTHAATLTFIYSLIWSQIRYRLPIMPFMIMFAAYALNGFISKKEFKSDISYNISRE